MIGLCQAAVIDRPETLSTREFGLPEIGPKRDLSKSRWFGVCATDPKIYNDDGNCAMSIVPGHQIVGRRTEVGESARKH